MKSIIFLLAISLTFHREIPQESDFQQAIDESDFVGFVIDNRDGASNEYDLLTVTEVFKGDVTFLKITKGLIYIDADQEYLLMANKDKMEITSINYPLTYSEKLSQTKIDILNNLPCYSESREKEYQERICTRELRPVCGCDKKTYGNLCELLKKGILKFKPGRCESSER